MSDLTICGFDTETHLITGDNPFPRLVCATFDVSRWGELSPDGTPNGTFQSWLTSNNSLELIEELLHMFQECYERRRHIVIQAASYDLGVVLGYCLDVQSGSQLGDKGKAAELYRLVWEVLERSMDDEQNGHVPLLHDTIIRQKLYNLSTTGAVEGAGNRGSGYSLADLVWQHFGIDISDSKVVLGADGRVLDADGNDITGTSKAAAAWRLRYSQLDGIPGDTWPKEAQDYAISDATWARKVFVSQEYKRKPTGFSSINSEALQVYADLCLRLYASTGFHIDAAQVVKAEAAIDEVIAKCQTILQANGIERANGTINTNLVKERIAGAWRIKGRNPQTTATGEISCGKEVLEELSGLDPILDLYTERQEVIKIKTAFLPSLKGAKVWSNYDILKETGRCSSFGDSDKKKSLYASLNIQQLPRKGGIREALLPPPGYVICSADYSALELCSVAQITYKLFNRSQHRELNLKGYDLHTYLGASMAVALAPHVVDHKVNRDEAYHALRKNIKTKAPPKDDTSPEAEKQREFLKECKMWRQFAKPVGLGYPGGLGPATQVNFAKTTYHVTMTEEQAKMFRDLWHQTYPEMAEFFQWVNRQRDSVNSDSQEDRYSYETPGLKRFRAGCYFCSTANGMSMQSLSADGAKRSVAWLGRACSNGLPPDDPYSLLGDCLPLAFIHDENLIAIPDDELLTERALLVSQLMVEAMKISMPDVLIKAEPALMHRWTKDAEPVWEQDPGRVSRATQCMNDRHPGLAAAVASALGDTYKPDLRLKPWVRL